MDQYGTDPPHKVINAAHECHDFQRFVEWLIAMSTVSVAMDMLSFYQIKQGYINAVVQVCTLLVDCMMATLSVFDCKEVYFAINTRDDTKLMIEQIVCFFCILARVIHIPVLLFFCLFCVPCMFCDCPVWCCFKKWQDSNSVNQEKGIFEEIDKQKWVYNTKNDLEIFQRLYQLKFVEQQKASMRSSEAARNETETSFDVIDPRES